MTLTVAVGATGYQLGAAAHIRDPILMDQTTLLEFLHMEALKLHMSKDSSYGLEEGDYLVSRPYLQLKERSTLPAADLQATVHLTHIDDGKGDSFSVCSHFSLHITCIVARTFYFLSCSRIYTTLNIFLTYM